MRKTQALLPASPVVVAAAVPVAREGGTPADAEVFATEGALFVNGEQIPFSNVYTKFERGADAPPTIRLVDVRLATALDLVPSSDAEAERLLAALEPDEVFPMSFQLKFWPEHRAFSITGIPLICAVLAGCFVYSFGGALFSAATFVIALGIVVYIRSTRVTINEEGIFVYNLFRMPLEKLLWKNVSKAESYFDDGFRIFCTLADVDIRGLSAAQSAALLAAIRRGKVHSRGLKSAGASPLSADPSKRMRALVQMLGIGARRPQDWVDATLRLASQNAYRAVTLKTEDLVYLVRRMDQDPTARVAAAIYLHSRGETAPNVYTNPAHGAGLRSAAEEATRALPHRTPDVQVLLAFARTWSACSLPGDRPNV